MRPRSLRTSTSRYWATDDEVGDAPALAALLNRFDDLLDRADQGERGGAALVRAAQPVVARGCFELVRGVIGDDDPLDQGVDLDLMETLSRLLAQPGDLAIEGGSRAIGGIEPAFAARPHDDADDIGLPGRQGEHPLATRADQQGRMRLLHRFRLPIQFRDLIVPPVEGDRLLPEETFDDLHAFFQASHPHPRRIEGDAGALVISQVPPRAEAKLEPATGNLVDRGRLRRHEGGMAKIVIEHEGQTRSVVVAVAAAVSAGP